jgi:hypothetical protein
MWELIVGFLSATFVLPVIQQPRWTSKVRAGATFVYSVLVGSGTAYLTGAFSGVHDVRQGIAAVLLMLIAAISTYKGFAQPFGIAPALERATSVGPPPATTA